MTIYYITCITLLVHFIMLLLIYGKFILFKDKINSSNNTPPVSIVICSRNSASELKNNLIRILEQNYPFFEVIVVNDDSVDDTQQILNEYQKKYNQLKIINLSPKLNPGKKDALEKGITSASHEIILLTDSDCRPYNQNWIHTMVSKLNEGNQVVLGYGPYQKNKGFLNKLIRLDTVRICVQYMSMALHGLPYMGVGRNLMYLKSDFINSDRFERHKSIASGDDDLLVQQNLKEKKTGIVICKSGFVFSDPKTTWSSWIRQKTRHISTASQYLFIHQILLFAIQVIPILIYGLGIVHFIHKDLFWSGLVFLFYYFNLILFSHLAFRKLGEKDLILFIPLLDIIYIFAMGYIGIKHFFSKKSEWN